MSSMKNEKNAHLIEKVKGSGAGAGSQPVLSATAGGDIPMEHQVGTPQRTTGPTTTSTPTSMVGNLIFSDNPVAGSSKLSHRRYASPRRTRSTSRSAPSSPLTPGRGTTAVKGVDVTTPPGAGNPPNRVIQEENMMDKTVTNVSTISSVDNSGGLHGFSQINDSNYVPITEKSVVVYNPDKEHEEYDKFLNDLNRDLDNDLSNKVVPLTDGDSGDDGKEKWQDVRGGRKRGRGGKGVTGTKGKELAESKQGKGDSDVEVVAGTSTNRAHRLRSEKRKVQNPSMSYAKAARVSGLRVEIRAVSDLDDGSHDIDPDIHTLDQEDWDAIEGAIEDALSNESMFTNFEPFDIADVILARGHKNGGFWVECATQATVDFWLLAIKQALVPEGREKLGYKYVVYGPNEIPFRYLTVRTIKKLAWKPRHAMEDAIKAYNKFLRGKHVKVVKGCVDKAEDIPSGNKYWSMTMEVAEDALDDIIANNCMIKTSVYSWSPVYGKCLKEWKDRKSEGFPPLEEEAERMETVVEEEK